MRVASLRLRLLAAVVDAVFIIGGMGALIGLGIGGVVAYARVRGGKDERASHGDRERDGHEHDERSEIRRTIREFGQSPDLRAALSGASAGLAVAGRNWRGPGFRVIGLRRVDAHTGGIVTVRSALISVLVDQARQAATRRLFASRAQRHRDRMTAVQPQLKTVEREHADDPAARHQAAMDVYKANDVNPLRLWGWLLAGPVAAQLVDVIGSRGRRTIRDRITSTSVIVDR
jgi:hypothetical protein